jgi:hypothetical protein
MGAGRSGTTLLTTLLGNAKNVIALGEMHQFLDYVIDQKPCSCGANLSDCEYWKKIISGLTSKYTKEQLIALQSHSHKIESHTSIVRSLVKSNGRYIGFNKAVFAQIEAVYGDVTVVDSSKYLSRGIQLSKAFKSNLKLVYMVRDVRGVINSFKKNVQTPKSALGSIVYYKLINAFGLLVQLLLGKRRVCRIKYEDLIENPDMTLSQLGLFLNLDLTQVQDKLRSGESFVMPHIVAGNRMRSEQNIKLVPDLAWKHTQSRSKQILYYLATLPFQLIFKYRV